MRDAVRTRTLRIFDEKCWVCHENDDPLEDANWRRLNDKPRVRELFMAYLLSKITEGFGIEDIVPANCTRLLGTAGEISKELGSPRYIQHRNDAHGARNRLLRERLISIINRFTLDPHAENSEKIAKTANILERSLQSFIEDPEKDSVTINVYNSERKDYWTTPPDYEFTDPDGNVNKFYFGYDPEREEGREFKE